MDKTGKYGYIHQKYVKLYDDEPTPEPTEEPTSPPVNLRDGDVNGDLLVSAADVAMILRYDAGLIDLSNAQLLSGDVDKDGEVSEMDAKAILKQVTGKLAR